MCDKIAVGDIVEVLSIDEWRRGSGLPGLSIGDVGKVDSVAGYTAHIVPVGGKSLVSHPLRNVGRIRAAESAPRRGGAIMVNQVVRWITEGTNTLFTTEEAVHFAQARNSIALAVADIEERKGSLVHELCEGELGEAVHTYRAQKENFEANEFMVEPGSTGAIKVIRYEAQDGSLLSPIAAQ